MPVKPVKQIKIVRAVATPYSELRNVPVVPFSSAVFQIVDVHIYLKGRFSKLIFISNLDFRDLTAHIRHRHKANEAVAQGLQIELPGTDGGTPVAPPAQPTQPPPTTNNPPSNPGPPIHSGQSGYPGHGSGGFNDYPARNYPDRDSRGPPSGRKPPPQTSGWPQDPPTGYRDGERSRGGRGRGGHSDRGRGGYKDGYGGGRPISQGQWGPR